MTYKSFPLGTLCRIEKGVTGITKAVPGPYPMVTLAENRISHDEYQFDANAVIVPLISSTGHGHASMKRVHYQEGKFALGSILCALVPNDETELNSRFLYNYLSFFKDSLLVPLMRGAANVSLSIKSIARVTIPLPPMAEQLEANELIEAYSLKVADYQAELQAQQNLLTKLRQSILQEAVQGKLTERWRKERSGLKQAGAGQVAGSNSVGGLANDYQTPTENPVTLGGTGSSPVRTANQADETGAELLARIRAEKAELIRQGKIRKEKPLPPITDAEKPFDLPEGWVWCRLGEILESSFYGPRFSNSDYVKDGIPTVRTTDMTVNGKIVLNNTPTVKVPKEKLSLYQVVDGDLLITRSGSIGIMAVFRGDYIAIPSAYLIRFRFLKGILTDYVFTLLKSPHWQTMMGLNTTSTAQININATSIHSFLIPIPPVKEQQAIVTQVEDALAQVSGLEAENRHQQAEVGRLMQAVLREAFASNEVVAEDNV